MPDVECRGKSSEGAQIDTQCPPTKRNRTRLSLDASSKATPASADQIIATNGAAHVGLTPALSSSSISAEKARFHNEADEFIFKPGFPYSKCVTNIKLELNGGAHLSPSHVTVRVNYFDRRTVHGEKIYFYGNSSRCRLISCAASSL